MDSADHRLDPTWQDYDMENWTWTFISIADHCFLQSRTRLSPMLWFLDNLPFYRLASTAASRTAFSSYSPWANFAVNCRTDSSKVGFNDGVVIASPFQSSDLKPSSFLIVVLKQLKTRKISHYDQLKNSTQYLISAVTPIPTTNHDHFLV